MYLHQIGEGNCLTKQHIFKKPKRLYFLKKWPLNLSSLEEHECLMLLGCSCPVPGLCPEADFSARKSMGDSLQDQDQDTR